MITNAIKEIEPDHSFLGHISSNYYIIVTSADRCKELAQRCLQRLKPSVQYFYPALERQRISELPESHRLTIRVWSLSAHEHQFATVDDLFTALKAIQ